MKKTRTKNAYGASLSGDRTTLLLNFGLWTEEHPVERLDLARAHFESLAAKHPRGVYATVAMDLARIARRLARAGTRSAA
ncbi:hypothetical protein [Pseudoroseicyclus sp. CXY001]|uniref:hypothetical protein n=1 Tax=Pseudoroseicyclus sp. CXY001 TaxID=3242492 RepID=UPI003570BDD2